MAEPYLGEIRIFGFGFAPRGWAKCDGQLLTVSQNQSLFSILGTVYGGDGQTDFALPDLKGRTPVGTGSGLAHAQKAGEHAVALTESEIPSHTHQATASGANATSGLSTGQLPARSTLANMNPFSPTGTAPDTTMDSRMVANEGGGAAHTNMQPYQTVNICIAIQGLFPSQS